MTKSQQLFTQAQQVIPGGVNSPVRAFKSVGGTPIFFERAKGAYLYDVDGNQYIDYVGSWGPMILGHGDDDVINALQQQIQKGISYGAPCEAEVKLAEKICSLIPSVEQVRFVSSGTEATMSAVRLARAYTQRDKIIKFAGHYHGHADQFLVAAGSGALTLGAPNSPGVPQDTVKHTLTADYNDIDSVKALFEKYPNEIACIIVEPIAGNMNFIQPSHDFLQQLQAVCQAYDALLIFDEVMTGFRVGLQGAQGYYGIRPDLTTFGKVIGGGMPVGAFGGRREIMQLVSPAGSVYQAGTLSGNPVAMTAGITTLDKISQPEFFEKLSKKTQRLVDGFNRIGEQYQTDFYALSLGGMFGIFFNRNHHIHSFTDMQSSDIEQFKAYFHFMLENGVYLAPSAYEAGFVSIAHTDADIDHTLALTEQFFKR